MNLQGFRRFLGLAGQRTAVKSNTAITTVGAGTLTAASLVGSFITRTGPTAAFTDTTGTAAAIAAALPCPPVQGMAWEVTYRNNSGQIGTLAGGTGVTASGITVVPPYSTYKGLLTYSSGGAWTLVGMSVSAGNSGVSEVVTTTNVIDPTENGSTYYLNNATGFVSTLPAPFLGAWFEFVVSLAVTTTGGHTVIAASSATICKGHVLTNDVNSATDSDFGTAGELTVTFVINKSVAGDRARFTSDGTTWFVQAACSVFDAITIS